MADPVKAAFERVCDRARRPREWYVTLMVSVPFYGGPEEGGWWGSDERIVAYQKFPSKALALAARRAVRKLARRLDREARRAHGEHCLRTMEFLEARGLEADYLREDDGPSHHYVMASRGLPAESIGSRRYE